MLDAIVHLLPAPEERPPLAAALYRKAGGHGAKASRAKSAKRAKKEGTKDAARGAGDGGKGLGEGEGAAEDQGLVERRRTKDEKLVALAFKVVHDKHMGDLVLVRVYSGVLHAKAVLLNTSQGVTERPLRLLRVMAEDYHDADVLCAGEIAAVTGLKSTRTGDTLNLASDRQHVVMSGLEIPPPVFFCSIEVDSKAEEPKLEAALRCMAREDPSLVIREDAETGQTLLGGMGELHLEVTATRLERQFDVQARRGKINITYREAPSARVEQTYIFDQLVGGKPGFAEFHLSVGPYEDEEGTEAGPGAGGGMLDGNYIDVDAADVVCEGSNGPEAYDAVYQAVESALSAGASLRKRSRLRASGLGLR